jgi:hypothetical protein
MSTSDRRREPAPGAPVRVELFRVPKEGIVRVRLLGPIRGILTHWIKGKSVACPGKDACPDKEHRSRTVWKGYCAAERARPDPFRDWCPCVLEITERAYEVLAGLEPCGVTLELYRQRNAGKNKEVTVTMLSLDRPAQLRPAFAVEPILFRVYRTDMILLDVEPLLPPPLMLEPTPGVSGPRIVFDFSDRRKEEMELSPAAAWRAKKANRPAATSAAKEERGEQDAPCD